LKGEISVRIAEGFVTGRMAKEAKMTIQTLLMAFHHPQKKACLKQEVLYA